MSSHWRRFLHGRVAVGSVLPIAVALLAGLALGCSEETTTSAFQPPEPSFHHNSDHAGGPPGAGDESPALQLDLVDPAGLAGVYPDGNGTYPSTMLDDAGGLHPPCSADRKILLDNVVSSDETVIAQADIDEILTNQSTCNGDTGGSNDGRVFLKAPGMLDLTENCDSGDADSTNDCPFDTYPSYEWKGNRIKPTGGFRNAARHFEEDTVTGDLLTWVFQDPKVTVTKDAAGTPIAWRFQATRIHLYGLSELCLGGGDVDQDGVPEGCLDFDLNVDYTIEPESEAS